MSDHRDYIANELFKLIEYEIGTLPGWQPVRVKRIIKVTQEQKNNILLELIDRKFGTLEKIVEVQKLPLITDYVKVRERLLSLLIQHLAEHHHSSYIINNYDWLINSVIYTTDDKLTSFLHSRVLLGKVTTFSYRLALNGQKDKRRLYEFIDKKVRENVK